MRRAKDLVSSDLFVVPTVFFRVLFVFVILSHDRRLRVDVAVTDHPTSEWVAHQLLEAFPWDGAPQYLLRDRDGSYGERVVLLIIANHVGLLAALVRYLRTRPRDRS